MNEEKLIQQYYTKVVIIAKKFLKDGFDLDDLIQEGLLGLLSAIRNYNPDYNISLNTYAEVCIKNRILDSIKNHHPEESLDEDIEIVDYSVDPENNAILNDYLIQFINSLSELEYKVLNMILDGYTNAKIAQTLNKSVGSIYNANQRIKQKLSAQISPSDIS